MARTLDETHTRYQVLLRHLVTHYKAINTIKEELEQMRDDLVDGVIE